MLVRAERTNKILSGLYAAFNMPGVWKRHLPVYRLIKLTTFISFRNQRVIRMEERIGGSLKFRPKLPSKTNIVFCADASYMRTWYKNILAHPVKKWTLTLTQPSFEYTYNSQSGSFDPISFSYKNNSYIEKQRIQIYTKASIIKKIMVCYVYNRSYDIKVSFTWRHVHHFML